MATSFARNSMECSCSGRGSTSLNVLIKRPNARALVPRPVQAVRVASPAPRPSLEFLTQPPLQRRAGRRGQQPLRVAEEIQETDVGSPDDDEEADAEPLDIEALNEKWGIRGAIEFGMGQGDLPTVLLTHPQTGQQLVVYLYGATIAQWLKHDGTATFYDGPDELYQEGMPLRTGVSLHFPQHRDGQLPQHGFADSMMWEVVGAGMDCPEFMGQLYEYLESMQKDGSVDPALVARAQEGDEEAQEALGELFKSLPVPQGEVSSDLAPCVTLRLRDTPETRAVWPHRFELQYKITLMAQGPMTEEEERDIIAAAGRDPNVALAEEELEDEALLQLEERMEELRAAGEDGEEAGEEEAGDIVAGKAARRAAEAEEEEEEEETEMEAKASADSAMKRRGRPPKAAADAGGEGLGEAEGGGADGAGEAGGEGEGEGDEDEEEDEAYDAEEELDEGEIAGEDKIVPAVQIKQEFWVYNKDAPGSAPMHFNLASLARFVTMQQPECSDWVKVLGLGGSQTFDYTEDPRYPKLDFCDDDYLHFRGQPIDTTYVGAGDATVYLCPGNRSHFEFIQAGGFKDMFIEQPSHEADEDYTRVAAIGTGYVATEASIEPGEGWFAESVIRFHPRYWRPPIFGDDSMPPIPPIPAELLEGGEGEDEGADAYDELPEEAAEGLALEAGGEE